MSTEAQRELIIEAALARFRQVGIRRVRMDDIARELRISKKTIYRHFPDKGALAEATIERITSEITPRVRELFTGPGSPSERLAAAVELISRIPRYISPQFLGDVKSDYPAIWAKLDSRRQAAVGLFEHLIADGIACGDVRPEIHPKVAARVVLAIVQNVLVPEVLMTGEFTATEAFATATAMMTHGVLARAPADKGAGPAAEEPAARRQRVKEARR